MPARILLILTSFFTLFFLSVNPIYGETIVKNVVVDGRKPWTDAGIDLTTNSNVFLKYATGTVYYAYFSKPPVSPTGLTGCIAGSSYVLSGATCYSLIGRIDNNPAFQVNMSPDITLGGKLSATFTATSNGRLFLGVNDEVAYFDDNLSSWTIDIIVNLAPSPPPGPTPFLDLPWEYEGKGLSFNEAAQAINAFFDHEYPLLSSGLSEPEGIDNSIIIYKGPPRSTDFYSSHDGYDYGKVAGANLGDPVLATAAGCAFYRYSNAGGNVILIDHGNHYQTRYLHLQSEGLITKNASPCVQVSKGQQIGKVGATGNVSPPGEAGAHIHFMVVEDKNRNGNFDDNIPDGVTDPFGWQSKESDPWQTYSFFYNGQQRTGNRSYYLWTKKIANLDATLTSNGGVFNLERYSVDFSDGATNQNLILKLLSSPIVNPSNVLSSIGSTLIINAIDSLGNAVTNFQKLFTVTVDFNSFDLTRYNTDTLAIYSSSDGINWTKEVTTVDLVEKSASAQVNHLTHFALMAERIDTTAPTTSAVLTGSQGQPNWFRSDVQVTLVAEDNEGGLGVDYTLYKLEGGDWQEYTSPLSFTNEGHYKIEFYSVDNDENIEEIKSVEFNIDKTPPEAKVFVDQDKLDMVVEGIDQNLSSVERLENVNTKKKDDAIYTISDLAGNTLNLDVRERDKEKKDVFRIHSLQYNQTQAVELPDNRYIVSYKGKREKRNVEEQKFEIEKEIKIKIKYDSKENKSTIITREPKEEKVKEVRDGLILLQLVTENGTLKYSY